MDLASEKGGSPQARGAGLPQFLNFSRYGPKLPKSTIKGGDPACPLRARSPPIFGI